MPTRKKSSPNKLWRDAYLRTSYLADAPHGAICLRVGERNAALDRLLAGRGTETWAFVTACNPSSRPLSDTENRERHLALVAQVTALGYPFVTGRGIGDGGDWPAEESLLILGVSRDDAEELGRAWEQNAFIYGRRGDAPELVWCSAFVSAKTAAVSCR